MASLLPPDPVAELRQQGQAETHGGGSFILFSVHSSHLISTAIKLLFEAVSIWSPDTNIESFSLWMGKGYKGPTTPMQWSMLTRGHER